MGGEAALQWLWSASSSKSNLEHNQLSFEARSLNEPGGGFRFCGLNDQIKSIRLGERQRKGYGNIEAASVPN